MIKLVKIIEEKAMKKMILLWMFLCVGGLNGMEKENPEFKPEIKSDLGAFEQLPRELRKEIAQIALVRSATVDEAIKAIQNIALIYGNTKLDSIAAMNVLISTLPNDLNQAIQAAKKLQGNNLKDFTSLAHILADKFNVTTEEVAQKFGTPLAEKYKKKGHVLLQNLGKWTTYEKGSTEDHINNLIQKGADVNFTGICGGRFWVESIESPLGVAIIFSNLVGVEALLKHGAIVTNHILSLAEKMLMFTNVNAPLDKRLLLVKNDKNLIEVTRSMIYQMLERMQVTDREENEEFTNALKIYGLIFDAMNK